MSLSSQAVRLSPPTGVVVLAGYTGSGKTDLLRELAATGEPVLDLAALASHRGSAFGGLGLPPQPTHRAFGRQVLANLDAADLERRRLWIEDEGPFIGRVGVPDAVQQLSATAPVVELVASPADRVTRIVETYAPGGSPSPALRTELVAALERSTRRIGVSVAQLAIAHVERGELSRAVELLLPAYDAAYDHRMERARRRLLGQVNTGQARHDA